MFTNAYSYDQFMGRWSRLVAPRLVEFAKIPDCDGIILDAGCGIGALALTIAGLRRRYCVLGVDISEEYIRYAESHNNHPDRVHFRVGDVQNLTFSDAAFHYSLSLLMLNFIPNGSQALSEMARVTRPGGQIVGAVWDYGDCMDMLRFFWDAAVVVDPTASNLHEKNMPLCRRGELSDLWKSAGLTNIVEKPLDIDMNFKSFHDYWRPFLMGQGPAGAYVKQLGYDRLAILREQLKRKLEVQDESAPFTLQGRVWAVRGFVPESK